MTKKDWEEIVNELDCRYPLHNYWIELYYHGVNYGCVKGENRAFAYIEAEERPNGELLLYSNQDDGLCCLIDDAALESY